MLVTNILLVNRAQRTRRRLQEHAIRLFAERGFDNVTVEDVARAAGVSHMTFFRNFPTKESVVLDDPYDPVIGEAVARQEVGLSPLERVRLGVLDVLATLRPPDDETMRTRLRLAAGNASLRARVWENNLRTEEVIVDSLTGAGVDILDARVAAGAVNGALTAALFDWAESDGTASLGETIGRALETLSARNIAGATR